MGDAAGPQGLVGTVWHRIATVFDPKSGLRSATALVVNAALNALWVCVLGAAVFSLGFRFYLASIANYSDANLVLIKFIVIAGLIYILFLLEGLLRASVQIADADEKSLIEYVKEYQTSKTKVLLQIITRLRASHAAFVTGRQVLATLVVVLVALTFNSLRINPQNKIFAALDAWSAGTGQTAASILDNFVTIFLMSTLLPCWIGQLLPQLLSDQRAVEFAQYPFAKSAVWASLALARLGAGLPGSWFYQLYVWKTGRFTDEEKIPVGDAKIFEATASYFGVAVSERKIRMEITEGGVRVSDATTYEFFGGQTSEVCHLVKVLMQDGGFERDAVLKNWDMDWPEGARCFRTNERNMYLILNEAKDRSTAESTLEVVMAIQADLVQGLPLRGRSKDAATITAIYTTAALRTDEHIDTCIFDISRPTRRVTIDIVVSEGLILAEPKVSFVLIDEAQILGLKRPLPRTQAIQPQMTERGYLINADFPPHGARLLLELDAGRQELSARQTRDTASGR